MVFYLYISSAVNERSRVGFHGLIHEELIAISHEGSMLIEYTSTADFLTEAKHCVQCWCRRSSSVQCFNSLHFSRLVSSGAHLQGEKSLLQIN